MIEQRACGANGAISGRPPREFFKDASGDQAFQPISSLRSRDVKGFCHFSFGLRHIHARSFQDISDLIKQLVRGSRSDRNANVRHGFRSCCLDLPIVLRRHPFFFDTERKNFLFQRDPFYDRWSPQDAFKNFRSTWIRPRLSTSFPKSVKTLVPLVIGTDVHRDELEPIQLLHGSGPCASFLVVRAHDQGRIR